MDRCSPASSRRRGNLAVKVIRKGEAVEALGDVERSVMWEVHGTCARREPAAARSPRRAADAARSSLPPFSVLQQLSHNHIVRVMDVIEVVDATYIIMQRVDGPELIEFIERHPEQRLSPLAACAFLGQVLSALRHAHGHGFLHCDVKPVRGQPRPASTRHAC